VTFIIATKVLLDIIFSLSLTTEFNACKNREEQGVA
jgi:hypothetical protein